ncbi:hypothetical protein M0802_001552 [Mischocyttarus mexicanus]|nr:hypothetical protein M0802_001552 [Mischocyttarus mexicanus]
MTISVSLLEIGSRMRPVRYVHQLTPITLVYFLLFHFMNQENLLVGLELKLWKTQELEEEEEEEEKEEEEVEE